MGRNAGDILTNGLKFRNHLKKRLVLAFSEHFSREVFCGTKTQYMLGSSYMTTILGWQTWIFIILAPFNDSTIVCVDEYSTQICLTLEVVENYELCGFLQARNIQTFWSSPCTKRSGFPTMEKRGFEKKLNKISPLSSLWDGGTSVLHSSVLDHLLV